MCDCQGLENRQIKGYEGKPVVGTSGNLFSEYLSGT